MEAFELAIQDADKPLEKSDAEAKAALNVSAPASWGLFDELAEGEAAKEQSLDTDWGMSPPVEHTDSDGSKTSMAHAHNQLKARVPEKEKSIDSGLATRIAPESLQDMALATHYLICRLGSQQYALPIHQVREVLARRHEKKLPQQRSGIVGLVTVRGLVCPVVDISSSLFTKLEETTQTSDKRRCLVVCEVEQKTFCFHVDEVKQVAALDEFSNPIKPISTEVAGQKLISHVSHFQNKSVLFVRMQKVIPA
ncbi:MAG: chemotaxis protein CheW [Proteobacteria bacterium]|nr:chemotaxis protein CheW [Pseudomonadota bacterium]